MSGRAQCQRQVGVRPTTKWNAVTIPVAVICPHNALPGEKWCAKHMPKCRCGNA